MILAMWKKPTTKFSNVWDYKTADGAPEGKGIGKPRYIRGFLKIKGTVTRTQHRNEEAYDGKRHL